MEEILRSAIAWFIPAVLGGVFGWLAKAFRFTHGRRKERDDLLEVLGKGMRSLLRGEIVRAHDKYVLQDEFLSIGDMEYIQRTYESYRDLGGNDLGTLLYEEIKSKPIRD